LRRLLAVGLLLLAPFVASASSLPFEGRLAFRISTLPRLETASSVATGEVTLGPTRLDAFSLGGGVVGGPPVSTRVPTSANVAPLSGVRVTASNGAGVFARASAAAALEGIMPLRGFAKACLFGACDEMPLANVNIPLGVVGAGGTTTATAAVNLTVRGAPWTTGSAVVVTGSSVVRDFGANERTGLSGAFLSVVTPVYIRTNLPALPETFAFAKMLLTIGGDRCSNGTDDDGDGLADFPADPGCGAAQDPSEHGPDLPCDDAADGDQDGADDADDPGCTGPADPSEREAGLACDDGADDDGDGLSDEPGDPGCDGPEDPSERAADLPCDDEFDEDHDGGDAFPTDPGCEDASDPWESRDFILGPLTLPRVFDASYGVVDDDVRILGTSHQRATRWQIVAGAVVTGDLIFLNQTDATVEGGSVGGDLVVDTDDTVGGPTFTLVRIDGGSVAGDVVAGGVAAQVLRGGTRGGGLVLEGRAIVRVVGTPSSGAPGLVLDESGVLEGAFAGGAPYAIPFTRAPDAQLFVPEPSAAAGGATVLALLAALRSGRRR
jgi:hypothetical protein